MLKLSTSGSTGFRKTEARRSKGQPPRDAVKVYDEALDFIRRIETLAGLLEVPGLQANAEPLNALMVSEAGSMIGEQTARLRRVLDTILPPQ